MEHNYIVFDIYKNHRSQDMYAVSLINYIPGNVGI